MPQPESSVTSHSTGSNGLWPMRPTCSTSSWSVTSRVRAASTTKPSARVEAAPSAHESSTEKGSPSRAVTRTHTGRRRTTSLSATRAASSSARCERMRRTTEPAGMGRAARQVMVSPAAASEGAGAVRNCVGSSTGRSSRRSPSSTGAVRRTSTSARVRRRIRSRPPFPPPRRTTASSSWREPTTSPTTSPRLLDRS